MKNALMELFPNLFNFGVDGRNKVQGQIVAILETPNGRRRHSIPNLITTAGDIYYAQKAASESPTNSFTTFELGIGGSAPGKSSNRSAITTPVSGSQITFASTFPKTADSDPLNTGGGVSVLTFKGVWGQGVATANNIDRIIITVGSPGGTAPLLMYALFPAAFNKGAADTLTVFVNHTFLGV